MRQNVLALVAVGMTLCAPRVGAAQALLAVPSGASIEVSNGQLRLNAAYADMVTWGAHSLEYRVSLSAPLGDTASLATNSTRALSGGGYVGTGRIGYVYGDRGAPSARGFGRLGVAGGAVTSARQYFHIGLDVSADYDRHDVVSKESPDWPSRTPEAIGDYRVRLHTVMVGRFEWPTFAMALSAYGGLAWSHAFDVHDEEVCAPTAPGSATTTCRTLPTTDALPSRAELLFEAGASATLLFYGPDAVDTPGRLNPGLDLGFRMAFGDPSSASGGDEFSTLLDVGAFVTPDFGLVQTGVHFRTGVWVTVPLKDVADDTLSFTVQLGATY